MNKTSLKLNDKPFYCLIFTILIVLLQNKQAESIYCYECNSNWAACSDPTDLNLIQYNKVPCNGPCATWTIGNILYRGCSYDPTKYAGNPSSYTDANGVVYNYCYTELCNQNKLSSSGTVTTTATASNPTTTIVTTKSVVLTTTTAIATTKPVVLTTTTAIATTKPVVLTTTTTIATTKPVVLTTTTTIATTKPVVLTTTITTTKPIVITTTTIAATTTTTKLLTTIILGTTTTTVAPSMFCYDCNEKLAACGSPANLTVIQFNKIPCTGVCATWNNPADNNNLYRGCVTSIKTGGSGTATLNGITYTYCSANLCNTGGVSGKSLTTTVSSTTTTTKITTTTSTTVTTKTTTRITTTTAAITTTKTTTGSASCASVTGNYLISCDEFMNAVASAGYPAPTTQKYLNYVTQLQSAGGITTKREAAMFLAQILWESDGLQAVREYACVSTGCPGVYGSSQYPGQEYYGRGYIQLSWPYNYAAASQALFGDDRLLRNPDQVATDDSISWSTAFWYWKANVGSRADVKNGYFGSSTNAINGALECAGSYQDRARKRFEIYKKVLLAFHINETPIENGCYN